VLNTITHKTREYKNVTSCAKDLQVSTYSIRKHIVNQEPLNDYLISETELHDKYVLIEYEFNMSMYNGIQALLKKVNGMSLDKFCNTLIKDFVFNYENNLKG